MLKPSFDKKKRVYVEAAQQSYTFNSTIPNKISVINNAMAKYKGGYKIINQWSTSRISVFRSSQLNSFIIAHRGTVPSRYEDLRSDLRIAFTTESSDQNILERMERTVFLIKKIRRQEPKSIIYLSGHSLAATML
jgi:hypothetical protein